MRIARVWQVAAIGLVLLIGFFADSAAAKRDCGKKMFGDSIVYKLETTITTCKKGWEIAHRLVREQDTGKYECSNGPAPATSTCEGPGGRKITLQIHSIF